MGSLSSQFPWMATRGGTSGTPMETGESNITTKTFFLDATRVCNNIVRIEFPPLVRIGINMGHYWLRETTHKGPTRINAGLVHSWNQVLKLAMNWLCFIHPKQNIKNYSYNAVKNSFYLFRLTCSKAEALIRSWSPSWQSPGLTGLPNANSTGNLQETN